MPLSADDRASLIELYEVLLVLYAEERSPKHGAVAAKAGCTVAQAKRAWERGFVAELGRDFGPIFSVTVTADQEAMVRFNAMSEVDPILWSKTPLAPLGVCGTCPKCNGHMHVFTEDSAHVSLTLWILHPRKGASRGCEIARIERDELPEVFAYLRKAAARNAERFGGVPE